MIDPVGESEVRTAYEAVAADYAELLRDELASLPIERAVLAAFAELVRGDGGGPVADLGCGPGRVTANLHALGLPAFGVDLSHGMVAVARTAYPDLRFEQGSMRSLDIDDGGLAGIVAWYSIIHTAPDDLPLVFDELARVLRPGGRLLSCSRAATNGCASTMRTATRSRSTCTGSRPTSSPGSSTPPASR